MFLVELGALADALRPAPGTPGPPSCLLSMASAMYLVAARTKHVKFDLPYMYAGPPTPLKDNKVKNEHDNS